MARTAEELGLSGADDPVVSHACRHVHARYEPWLFKHVVRSWLFAGLLARKRSLKSQPHVLAISALFHDMGLAMPPDPQIGFEVVGAGAARSFADEAGLGVRERELIWDAIALHTTPSIARHKAAEISCCQAGIGLDFTGIAYDEVDADTIGRVVSAFPRLEMKARMKDCLCRVARESPRTTYDNAASDFGRRFVEEYTAFSIADALQNSPFAEE